MVNYKSSAMKTSKVLILSRITILLLSNEIKELKKIFFSVLVPLLIGATMGLLDHLAMETPDPG